MIAENTIIQEIRNDNSLVIQQAYNRYRNEFIKWCEKNYKLSEDDAREAYQSAFLVFYQKIRSGELDAITSTIKTYLFSIGKYKILEEDRRAVRFSNNLSADDNNPDLLEEESEEREYKISLIEKAVAELGEPCKTLIKFSYYDRYSMEEISEKMSYKNADTAKNVKYKCLQRLKKIVDSFKVAP